MIQIPGRMFQVDVFYTAKTQPDYLDSALVAVLQIHLDEKTSNGSILVFLTGQEDIETLETLLEEYARSLPADAQKLMVCPIFAAMPREQQMKVFEPAPAGVRKGDSCNKYCRDFHYDQRCPVRRGHGARQATLVRCLERYGDAADRIGVESAGLAADRSCWT